MSLKYTRQLIDAIHDGSLNTMEWDTMPTFGFQIPTAGIKDVPKEVLRPQEAWAKSGLSDEKFQETSKHLAKLFEENFAEYADKCSAEVIAAGPKA